MAREEETVEAGTGRAVPLRWEMMRKGVIWYGNVSIFKEIDNFVTAGN